MKKCYNCVYLSGPSHCSYKSNHKIKDKFILVYIMRNKNGLCGYEAKLYSSKYKRFCVVLGLFTICAIPCYYILKLLFE